MADLSRNIPTNGSISLTLSTLEVTTTVQWRVDLTRDRIMINEGNSGYTTVSEQRIVQRISAHLDHVRRLSGQSSRAFVEVQSTFPPRLGVSLQAPLFASLTVAAVKAAGQELPIRDLTALARLGAGPACQSVPGGFVEWHHGDSHETSYAESIAPAEHWPLVDLIAIVSGMGQLTDTLEHDQRLAPTSPLYAMRTQSAEARLAECRQAIQNRDFDHLADIVEMDSRLVRAVTLTSEPPLYYWAPSTLTIIDRVRAWRMAGLQVAYCVAPGPNAHCICTPEDADLVETQLQSVPGILDIKRAKVGGPTRLVG
ncbi:MAG: hypothetical protein JXB47_18730 [Anaerolineae bacterium]|nr:hypothetical protein [Anaerolineae bacterium]